eukprot:3327324-Amphidinium_carterae.1
MSVSQPLEGAKTLCPGMGFMSTTLIQSRSYKLPSTMPTGSTILERQGQCPGLLMRQPRCRVIVDFVEAEYPLLC